MIWLAIVAALMLIATIALLVVIQGKLYEIRRMAELNALRDRDLGRLERERRDLL
jgi:hypothetical protein